MSAVVESPQYKYLRPHYSALSFLWVDNVGKEITWVRIKEALGSKFAGQDWAGKIDAILPTILHLVCRILFTVPCIIFDLTIRLYWKWQASSLKTRLEQSGSATWTDLRNYRELAGVPLSSSRIDKISKENGIPIMTADDIREMTGHLPEIISIPPFSDELLKQDLVRLNFLKEIGKKFPKLQEFTIGPSGTSVNAWIPILALSCPNLQSIKIEKTYPDHDDLEWTEQFAAWICLANHCSRLQKIAVDFRWYTDVFCYNKECLGPLAKVDLALQKTAEQFQRLKVLHLFHTDLSAKGMKAIGNFLSLESLIVFRNHADSPSLTDADLKEIVGTTYQHKKCRDLKKAAFVGHEISNHGVETLLFECNSLEVLSIDIWVNPASDILYQRAQCPKLHTIRLGRCQNIPMDGILEFASNCPNLQLIEFLPMHSEEESIPLSPEIQRRFPKLQVRRRKWEQFFFDHFPSPPPQTQWQDFLPFIRG